MALSTLRKCMVCGTEYTRMSNVQKYCSLTCYRIAKNKRRRVPDRYVICESCGKTYKQHKSNQRVCSNNCYNKLYRMGHLKEHAFQTKTRKHEKRATSDGSVTFEVWERLKRACNYTCLCCGKQEPEVTLTMDHIKPLSKGGTHTIDNLQPLCMSCNCSKRNFNENDYRVLSVMSNDNKLMVGEYNSTKPEQLS